MGKLRAKRLLLRSALLCGVIVGLLWIYLAPILERSVPTVAARYGIRSESLSVLAVTPWSVRLGPFAQCYQTAASALCLKAAAAEVVFAWSGSLAPAVRSIWVEDAVITVAARPDAVESKNAPLNIPELLPVIALTLTRSNRPLELGSGGSYAVTGEFESVGDAATVSAAVESSGGVMGSISGRWRAPFHFTFSGAVERPELLEVRIPALGRLTFEGTVEKIDGFKAALKLLHPATGVEATGTCESTPDASKGSCKYEAAVGKLPLEGSALPFSALKRVRVQSGRLGVNGSSEWGTRVSNSVTATAKDLSGAVGPCEIAKLTGSLPLSSAKEGKLKIDSVRCGIELLDVGAFVSLHPADGRRAKFRELTARLLGGNARIENGAVGDTIELSPIDLRGLSLRELVSLHKQEYIEAEGRVDVTIPVEFSNSGITVTDGRLSSVGDGWIKYHGTSIAKEDQSLLGVTERALQEYRFNSLQAQLSYAPTGALSIGAQLQGTSPALNTDRPVHVNVALEENLLELFKSLQIANDVEQQLKGLR